MLLMRDKIRTRKYEKGFTLMELIIVITILGIISAIAIPSFFGTIRKVRKKVCSINCSKAEERYEIYLYEKGKKHSEIIFSQYIHEEGKDICPDSGVVSYDDGKIKCSVHPLDKDDSEGDVPYL